MRMGHGDGPPCHHFLHDLCLLEGRPLALGTAPRAFGKAGGSLEEPKLSGISAGPRDLAQSRVLSTGPAGG